QPVCYAARRGHDASGLLVFDQAPCRARRYQKAAVTPCIATCLRHASAQTWRGFAGCADAAGSCRYFNYADLYSRCARALEAVARAASSAWVMLVGLMALDDNPELFNAGDDARLGYPDLDP